MSNHTPLLVSVTRAQHLLGIGNTTFWKLVKLGRIQLSNMGGDGRRMVVYTSLETLAQPENRAA
jgi:hypothetical protein